MQTTNDIRSAFLGYFARHDHRVVPSSSLVPRNDPTLMFTNAGMVQFKNVFTGAETRDYVRAATSQKCVRAGGKHNDLENVGYTARHHTFFEMLGNFSFGDYFKERAIELAWTFVTRDLGLARDRLWVTTYPQDSEARTLWKKIAGLPDDRIVGHEDNLWAMGPVGPCGYCSEIFYDQGEALAGGPPGSPDEDGDRYLEFWNLVFMQFDQVDETTRIDLPKPCIDTGMGLERIAAILQGVPSNYDIDLMRGLIEASADASNTDPDGPGRISHRVIADHLRAGSFLIADGVLPSNEGRGYVLRRIMRRGMRHAHLLGCKEPLMYRLVPALTRAMGLAFPELGRAEPLIVETFRLEEERFKQTLGRGLGLLEEETAKLGSGQPLAGEVAFKLYDTFGFPLDLTQDILRGQGRSVDQQGFDAAMARQKQIARASWAGSGEAATEAVWLEIRQDQGASEFLGYDTTQAEGVIAAIVVDGTLVPDAKPGQTAMVVTNQTPFYAESGGQMGDVGTLATAGGAALAVSGTVKKAGDLHVHVGTVAGGPLKLGDAVTLAVDAGHRDRLRANHSATHLLHEALRRRLGQHVTQKGSLVAADRFRFDFSHPKPMTAEEIADVEAEVNARIRANGEARTRLMTPDEAIHAGALALFGEKYGDEVRVVSMGDEPVPGSGRDYYSTELCGGTHVRRTGDIALFKIVSEGALAAGVRRIEALTGEAARTYLTEEERLLQAAAGALKAPPQEVPARIAALVEERRRLERELAQARQQLATGGGGQQAEVKQVGDVRFIRRLVNDMPARELKGLADQLTKQIGSGVVAIVSVHEGKAANVVAVTGDLTSRIDAVKLVQIGVAELGGKGGGGRPDMAQGGGPNVDGADAALQAIEEAVGRAA